jgi:prepilin-type N-terminal cleavage/methylation domain-containing protein
MRSAAHAQRPTSSLAFSSVRRRAFTLIEILIVVVILGIIATLVIPKFSDAAHQAREAALKDGLRYLRMQVQVYRAQHKDTSPGYPGGNSTQPATEQAFIDQMTMSSDEDGNTNGTPSARFKFGPYLGKIPENPLTHASHITITTQSPLPAPTVDDGWFYNPQTEEVGANCLGSDNSGTPYAHY